MVQPQEVTAQSIQAPSISMPKGGGAIQGIGETFKPNAFSGTGSYSIPVPLTAARGFEPKLSIDYNSGAGNGVFGIGFSLSIPKITLRTSLGIPRYQGNDIYLLNGTELVKKDKASYKDDKGDDVYEYLYRTEGSFSLITHHIKPDQSTSYWQIISTNNESSVFGIEQSCQIYNPANTSQIFQWLLCESTDAKGNKKCYQYKAENREDVPVNIWEQGHSYNNKYLQSLKYGNYFEQGDEKFAFELVFDYGEYSLSKLSDGGYDPYKPKKEWTYRADSFSSFTSGFEIRTCRLCQNILLFHHFEKELGDPSLVKRLSFEYNATDTYQNVEVTGPSRLQSLTLTGYRREGKEAIDKYQLQSMPATSFGFSQFVAPAASKFEQLTTAGNPIPGYLDSSGFLPVDLNREGISGLLFTKGGGSYLEPEGNGEYAFPETPASFPINKNLDRQQNLFADLNGNGQLQLVTMNPTASGFYSRTEQGGWDNFTAFESIPNNLTDPAPEAASLNNDGKTDFLIVEENDLLVYESKGKKGYASPERKQKKTDFPSVKQNYRKAFVGFADMFGDGLPHRVQITDGSVECWPDLGYGSFAEKITLGNAPKFGSEFDISRLFIADVNGTATADLVYVYADRVELFLNESGNSFSDAISITLPEPFSPFDRIHFSDILGNGTTCLVFTKIDGTPRHYYYDFVGEIEIDGTQHKSMKPYLLNIINNNLGSTTQIQYCSSTKFYLEDKKAGKPWAIKLPFPVQVVEKTIVTDKPAGARYTHSYKYHDGFYDPVEREFRGFGYVETWDTEDYKNFITKVSQQGHEKINKENYVPPTYTRSWYNTGASFQHRDLFSYYKKQFYQGDAKAYDFPSPVWSQSLGSCSAETQRQAYVALQGQVIRKEVYGLDKDVHPASYKNPITVEESNVKVDLFQPMGTNPYAVFLVTPSESILYHYERNPQDPRIEQQFTLATDSYGNVLQACTIYLPRRPVSDQVIYPDQQVLRGILDWNSYLLPPTGALYSHTSYEKQQLELLGLDLEGDSYFSLQQLSQQVAVLGLPSREHILPYNASYTTGMKARQLTWERTLYWNTDQTDALAAGQISARGLVHHAEKTVFTDDFSVAVCEGRLIGSDTYSDEGYLKNILYTKGGYFYDPDTKYWWNKGLVQHYYDAQTPAAFFMPSVAENTYALNTQGTANPQDPSLGSQTTVTYDSYYLAQTSIRKKVNTSTALISSVIIDYTTLQPVQLTDHNNNQTQVLLDPLGQVIVLSISGTENSHATGGMSLYEQGGIPAQYTPAQPPSNLQEVVSDPATYLQGASIYYYYDLDAWSTRQQPANSVHLVRVHHWHSPQKDDAPYCQLIVNYSDGLGRELATKQQANTAPGNDNSNRWQVTGRTVYNNKGKSFEQYMPYYSDSAAYEGQNSLNGTPPTVTHYDALDRVVRIDTPKGFFSKIEFSPWNVIHYDENDTILDSPYYLDNYPNNISPAEKSALEQAAGFYNTPTTSVFDNTGSTVFEITCNLGNVVPALFDPVVKGTSITAQQVWEALKTAGYLASDPQKKTLTWVTDKFQPYFTGFTLQLPDTDDALIKPITNLLLQHCLTSAYTTDIQGRNITSTDPRLYHSNISENTQYYNFRYQYAMGTENPLYTDSADAGVQLHFENIFSGQLWSFSPRANCQLIEYDALQRKTALDVQKINYSGIVKNYASFNQVEVFTYGESQPNAAAHNLKGKLYQLKDLSGQTTFTSYNLLGQILQTTRQLAAAYKTPVDWNNTVALESDIFTTSFTYNALKLSLTETTPDGTLTTNTYLQTGQFYSTNLEFNDGSKQQIINAIQYDAKGQRIAIEYGNGINTEYSYEATTLRLTNLSSTRAVQAGGTASVQQLAYIYDPVGNITQKVDSSIDTVFSVNQKVDPDADYTYDALYRLINANGRQHQGINANAYKNNAANGNFMQSIFGPAPSTNAADKLENYAQSFVYDNSGNLIEKRHTAKSGSWTRNLPVMDNSNHFAGIRYDGSGNMRQLAINNTVELSFNCCENLVKAAVIERPAPQMDDADYYVYDSEERRTRKVTEQSTNGVTTSRIEDKIYLGNYELKRVYNGSTIAGDTLTQERQTLRVMDGQSCVAIIYYTVKDQQQPSHEGGRQVRFQLTEQLSSVSLEMDTTAQLISYEEYYPYGGTAIITGPNQAEVKLKEYRYSGKERDDSTGLYYYGARYYAPWLGRWLKPDPAGSIDGMNLYAFVKGNPILLHDKNGLMSSPNKFEWEVHSSTSYVSSDLDINNVLENFGHPTTSVVKVYDDLATRVGYDVSHGGVLQSTTVTDLHLAFEASLPLHYGFNDFLGDEWRANMATYAGSKKRIPLYSVMRSKTTNQFKSEVSVPGFAHFNDVLYEVSQRPAEIHHVLYKAVRPMYANQTSNLMLVERSPKESVDGPGQHELMHKLGSGNDSNKFSVLLTQFESEYISWYQTKKSVSTMKVSGIE
jgi:RHS repeat-associated protein